jgi:uncharacterized protein (TIGR00251 family)
MARLQVKVKPNARENKIIEQTADRLTVSIAAPPEDNKANIELIKFLSRQLKKQVRIVSGFGSKTKIVEILE